MDSTPDFRERLAHALDEAGDRLYALALRVTRDPDLAADAVQEAFATALEKAQSFRGEAGLPTWLHRIVYTKAVDLLRKRGREEALPDDPDELVPADHELAHAPAPPDAVLRTARARAALDAAFAELTPLQRAVFELREVEGRPTEEAAAALDLTPGAVRVHLHRARLRLRARLGAQFAGGRR